MKKEKGIIVILVVIIIILVFLLLNKNQNYNLNETGNLTTQEEMFLKSLMKNLNTSSFEKQDCLSQGKEILSLTKQAAQCNSNSDCVYDKDFLGCITACGLAHNKNTDTTRLKQLTNQFDKECAIECPARGCKTDYLVECLSNICQIV